MATDSFRLLIGCFVAVALLCAIFRPLAEPDEGRYAEAAREMVASGDFLLPHQNGVVYPDKPPGVYWMMAPAIALLGPTAFSGRFPALLAYLSLLLLLWRVRDEREPRLGPTAALIAAGSPLLMALGQLATLDMLLSFCSALAILQGWRFLQEGRPRHALLAGLGLGAGFLVKGPIGWLTPLAILLVAGLIERPRRRTLRLLHPYLWLPALAIGMPWYVAAASADPDLLDFWLGRETLGRVTSNVHSRAQPLWFFPAVALGALLPWWLGAIWIHRRQAPRWLGGDRSLHTVWAFLPIVLFSIPSGKQPAYLAPAIGGMALWLAQSWQSLTFHKTLLWVSSGLLVLLAGVGAWHLAPEHARSDDPFSEALKDASAEDWRGGQIMHWSYGFCYRLQRSDLEVCGPIPVAWGFAERHGRVEQVHRYSERFAKARALLASPEPAFLLFHQLESEPKQLAAFLELCRRDGVHVSTWIRNSDTILLSNRRSPRKGS